MKKNLRKEWTSNFSVETEDDEIYEGTIQHSQLISAEEEIVDDDQLFESLGQPVA